MDFEHFYITWYSRAKYFAREYVLSEEEAENITQDVFVDLYQKQVLLGDRLNGAAYLFTCIKNKCIDYLRHELLKHEATEKIREESVLSLRMKFDSLESFDTEWGSEQKLENAIRQALDSLPGRCREIFIKSKLEGKKHKEIAEEFGISVKTVENQMTIAYKKLKDELKDYLPFLFFFLS